MDSRERRYREIYQHVKSMHPDAREQHLADLADKNPDSLLSTNAVSFLSEADLQRLSNSGLVEIGGHTVTHPNLTLLATPAVEREMREGKKTIEGWIGRSVLDFSYPHGQSNPEIAQLAGKAGFRSATTTRSSTIRKQTIDWYHLPRLCFGGEVEMRTNIGKAVRGVYAKCWR
jgi:peptidoglycan/xylan/chitin deacetylase (PgdA/CDA1 family)